MAPLVNFSLLGLAAIVREARALVPELPLSPPLPLSKHSGVRLLPQRVAAAVGGALGGVGALLAGLGVYGLLAFSFLQRRREIGVRMAVGAGRADVGRILIGETARIAAAGIGIGTIAAAAVARGIASMLHDVSPIDPVAFAGGFTVVIAVALVSSLAPRVAHRSDGRAAVRLTPSERVNSNTHHG